MYNYRLSSLSINRLRNIKKLSSYVFIGFILQGTQAVLAQTEPSEKEVQQSPTSTAMSESSTILAITLVENGDKLTLYPDGTCSINNQDKSTLSEETSPWGMLMKKPYLESLSGLAILEQVKQQVQQSRMVMTIDTDAETTLSIQAGGNSQSISLYSIDLMHDTYPKAQMLGQFMEIVSLMREAKTACPT